MSNRTSNARVMAASAMATAVCFLLSDLPSSAPLRGALIFLGTAGPGAVLAWWYGWRSGFGLLSGLLTVECTFIAFQLWWVALVVARAGEVPQLLVRFLPYVALIGVHHGLLALAGGIVALSGSAALHRLRGPQPA